MLELCEQLGVDFGLDLLAAQGARPFKAEHQRRAPALQGLAPDAHRGAHADVALIHLIVRGLGQPLIRKERRGYRLPGGLTLEVNCVDPDLPTAFWYAEVEFETEAQALAWDPAAAGLADYLHDECTGKPGSSMGEYWLQTRK